MITKQPWHYYPYRLATLAHPYIIYFIIIQILQLYTCIDPSISLFFILTDIQAMFVQSHMINMNICIIIISPIILYHYSHQPFSYQILVPITSITIPIKLILSYSVSLALNSQLFFILHVFPIKSIWIHLYFLLILFPFYVFPKLHLHLFFCFPR